MKNQILKWFFQNTDDSEILKIIQENKIRINGFTNIKLINKKLNVPRVIILKELLAKNNLYKIENYLYKESIAKINYENYSIEEILRIDFNDNEFNDLLKYIMGTKNDEHLKIANKVFEKINMNNQLDKNDLKMDRDKIDNNDINLNLKEENDKLIKEIKLVKKELIKQKNENKRLDILIKKYLNDIEKEKTSFINLKKKYDINKLNEIDIKIDLDNKKKEISELSRRYKEIQKQLNEYKKKYELNCLKQVILFGEIQEKDINNLKKYKINIIEVKKIDENLKEIYECDEIWILTYDTSILEQKLIKQKIKNKKIVEFSNYRLLKSYINKGENDV